MIVAAESPADVGRIAAVTQAAFAANEHRPSPLDDQGRPVEVISRRTGPVAALSGTVSVSNHR